MNKKISVIFATALVATSLVGCSNNSAKDTSSKDKASSSKVESKKSSSKKTKKTEQQKTMDTVVEAANSQLPQLKKQYATLYSDIKISSEDDHTLSYIYTFKDKPETSVDMNALKPTLVKSMKPVVEKMKVIIPDIQIKVVYEEPNHKELGSVTITQQDTDAVQESEE